MKKLIRKMTDEVLLTDLEIAKSVGSRLKGLLGRSNLSSHQGLWIDPGNSIHTFFMKFAIDCIFVDSQLKVVALHSEVEPGRMIWPQWSARSVIEVPAGFIKSKKIQLGESLHVSH